MNLLWPAEHVYPVREQEKHQISPSQQDSETWLTYKGCSMNLFITILSAPGGTSQDWDPIVL